MPQTVVILVHGIRTAAWWQGRVASIIQRETKATVIPLKYGYFDLLRFWCPFKVCRNGPIERLRKQIEGIRERYKGYRLVVIAHSYGTHALSRILMDNPHFKFNRIILCGSIIPENFDWMRIESQVTSRDKRDAIINECGIFDVWPVLAKSASWGYGASGTFGFGSFSVRDRFHPNKHSGYFTEDFVRQYWLPAVRGEPYDFSEVDVKGYGAPFWFNILRFPLRWVIAAGLCCALLAVVVLPLGYSHLLLGYSHLFGGPCVLDANGVVTCPGG
jgi:pimeloyl-ACP methyl ester carboxylesterase